MIYSRDSFSKSINYIIPDGFERIQGQFVFKREISEGIQKIFCSYRDYSPHSFYIDGVSVDIIFNKVENLLFESFNRTKVTSQWGEAGTISKVFVNLPDVDYSVFNTEINNETSFMKVAAEIEKIISTGVSPFFEQYNTIKKVWEETEKMEIKEMVNFIGQPLPFRRMIIKKICKDPNYEEYAKRIMENSEKKNLPELKALKELYELLKAV